MNIFKNVLISFLLLFSSVSLGASSVPSKTLDDCKVDIYSYTTNDVANSLADCISEELTSESDMAVAINKAFQDLPTFLMQLKEEYEYLFFTAIVGILFLYLLITMFGDEKRRFENKSSMAMKGALFVLLGTTLMSTNGMQAGVNWVVHSLIKNITLPLTLSNNHFIQSKTFIDSHLSTDVTYQWSVSSKAKEISTSLFNSEICALKYNQKIMVTYDFEDTESYKESEDKQCMDSKMAEGASLGFIKSGYRSPLNYATLQCSQSRSGIIIDCGSLSIKKNESQYSELFEKYAELYQSLAKEFDNYSCSTLALENEEMAKSYCKNWTGSNFELKTSDKTIIELNNAAENLYEAFLSALKEYTTLTLLAKGLDSDVSILNLLRQAYLLAWLDPKTISLPINNSILESIGIEDRGSEIQEKAEESLEDIIIILPTDTNKNIGNHLSQITEEDVALSVEIRGFKDYYYHLEKTYANATSNFEDAGAFETLLSTFSIKNALGETTNDLEGSNYELDFWTIKNLQNMTPTLAMTSITLLTLSNFKLKAAIQSKDAKKIKNWKLLNAFFKGCSILILSTPLLICFSIMSFFSGCIIYILSSLITLFVKAMFIFVTRYKFESLIESLLKIMMNVYMPLSFMCTILFTHIGLAISMQVLDATGLFTGSVGHTFLANILYIALSIIIFISLFFKSISFFNNLLAQHMKVDYQHEQKDEKSFKKQIHSKSFV